METLITPYQPGDKVILGTFFGLGEVVHGVQYEYLLEDLRGEEVTILNHINPAGHLNTIWYKVEEMPFTISHQMIFRKK